MATSVAAPLEQQFGQIAGITQMTSQSTLGASTIVIQFELERNIDSAAQDVQAAITVASKTLPQSLSTPPAYKKVNPADVSILLFSVHSDTVPLIKVDEYANIFLAQQISQVPGVAQVSVFGDRAPSIRIQVDPAKLAASGITLEDIRGTLASRNDQCRQGRDQQRQDQLSRSPPTTRSPTPTNSTTWCSPIATALRSGFATSARRSRRPVDRNVAGYQNNRDGVILAVFKQPGANVIDTVDRIKAELPQLTARIPPAVKIETILDRTVTIRASVADVEFTLVLTICLVVMVILLFLRNFWATLIPSVTVPLALAGSFAAMYLMHFQPRQPVADGADYRGRVRRRRRHRGGGEYLSPRRTRRAAVHSGSQGLARDRLHRVVDLLLADRGVHSAPAHERHHRPAVPRIRVDGHSVDRVSAMVSLTLAPMMCSRFMKREAETHGRVYRVIEGGFNAMLSFYRRTLDIVLRHQAITLGVFFATMALTVVMAIDDPEGVFPDPGHRHHHRLCRGRAADFAETDDASDAHARRRNLARSRRRELRLSDRLDRQRADRQYRPLFSGA